MQVSGQFRKASGQMSGRSLLPRPEVCGPRVDVFRGFVTSYLVVYICLCHVYHPPDSPYTYRPLHYSVVIGRRVSAFGPISTLPI